MKKITLVRKTLTLNLTPNQTTNNVQ